MARFAFRLQSALEAAVRAERSARGTWLRAEAALAAARAGYRSLAGRLAAERLSLGRGTVLRAGPLALAEARRSALEGARDRAGAALADEERASALRRLRFEACVCKRLALERLRERDAALHRRSVERALDRELEESNGLAARVRPRGLRLG